MIKTKIADVFIKDKNFNSDKYLQKNEYEQFFNLETYPDLLDYKDFFSQTELIETLTYDNINNSYLNYKQCKLLNTDSKNVDYFEIYEKNNSRGELYRNGINKVNTLCLTDISLIDSFKSYLACYLNNELIIVHSNINNKVIFTKIYQDEFGQYQKLNFSEINGNYKVVSLNVYENDIYLFLCDNITTYIYKISDYVVSLIKTVTENVIFQEQKYYTLNENGTPNIFLQSINLKNSEKIFNYEINSNIYNFTDLTIYEENYNYFSNYIFFSQTNPEEFIYYFQNYFLNHKDNTDMYNIQLHVKNDFEEFLAGADYELTNVLEDIVLLNVNLNAFILIYRATDNTTKILYRSNTFFSAFGALEEIASITEKIKSCSFLRYFDDLIINIVDENSNIHKITINMSSFFAYTETGISIEPIFPLPDNNCSYFVKVKN